RDICRAEIRLARNAALGHRRKPPAAWKRGSFSRTNGVGALPMADDKQLPGIAATVGNDYVAAGGAIRRRRAEARSRSLSLEVMHLNRAAEAGALSASFAHDLGQPLVSIGLNAER